MRLKSLGSAIQTEFNAIGQGIGFVRDPALVDGLAMNASTLIIVDGANTAVDWNFMKIRAAQSSQLRICVRK